MASTIVISASLIYSDSLTGLPTSLQIDVTVSSAASQNSCQNCSEMATGIYLKSGRTGNSRTCLRGRPALGRAPPRLLSLIDLYPLLKLVLSCPFAVALAVFNLISPILDINNF